MIHCQIADCGKPHEARGWCAMHYVRWQRHGDPIGSGRTSPGEPERYFHDVVLAYEGDECLAWPYGSNQHGYGMFGGRSVSRRVCEEVNGPPPTPRHEAAHSCGRGHLKCCTKRHLSWKTHGQNEGDKLVHGTSNRGERSASAKLSEAQVRQIRSMKGTMLQREIAVQFGVSQELVGRIHRKLAWGWLQ